MQRHPMCEIFQVLITNRKPKHVFNSERIYHNCYNKNNIIILLILQCQFLIYARAYSAT
jgi:hypothetical protein